MIRLAALLVATVAHAGTLAEDIERAEAVMMQPWHISDTLTGADRGIVAPAYMQTGKASWYSTGQRTATGEKFPTAELTCAHKTLGFGTMVRVTRTDTGQSIRCRINDRGPFVSGRVIDLNPRAALGLGMTEAGVVKVRVEVIE